VAVSDICAGMFAAVGILAAVRTREKTGRGQAVDVSILDGQVSWLSHQAGSFFATGVNPEKLGSAHPTIAPYQAFKAADSYFVVAVGNDALWKAFCHALGLDSLIADPRFATNPDRVRNRHELTLVLEHFFAGKDSREWLETISRAGVPCGPVNALSQVFEDPQVIHRDMVQEMQHPRLGKIKVVGIPIKMSDTPGRLRMPPPMLGEHTKEVLRGLGFDDDEIEKLALEGIL